MPEGGLLFHLMSARVTAFIGATVASPPRQSVAVSGVASRVCVTEQKARPGITASG